jgi:hypothetical protein
MATQHQTVSASSEFFDLSVANSYSGRNRCVKQTATMLRPSVLAKSSKRER